MKQVRPTFLHIWKQILKSDTAVLITDASIEYLHKYAAFYLNLDMTFGLYLCEFPHILWSIITYILHLLNIRMFTATSLNYILQYIIMSLKQKKNPKK